MWFLSVSIYICSHHVNYYYSVCDNEKCSWLNLHNFLFNLRWKGKNNETFSQLWKKKADHFFYATMVKSKWKMSKCHISNFFQFFDTRMMHGVTKTILELLFWIVSLRTQTFGYAIFVHMAQPTHFQSLLSSAGQTEKGLRHHYISKKTIWILTQKFFLAFSKPIHVPK